MTSSLSAKKPLIPSGLRSNGTPQMCTQGVLLSGPNQLALHISTTAAHHPRPHLWLCSCIMVQTCAPPVRIPSSCQTCPNRAFSCSLSGALWLKVTPPSLHPLVSYRSPPHHSSWPWLRTSDQTRSSLRHMLCLLHL